MSYRVSKRRNRPSGIASLLRPVFAALVAVAVLLVACAPEDDAPEDDEPTAEAAPDPDTAGVVNVGIRSPIPTLDPYNSPDEVTGGTVGKLIYQALVWVEVDEDGELRFEPLLATSWERIEPLVWELELREGVQFHDGSPFSAEDVEFTLERYDNPNARTGNAWAMGWFDSVDVIDDYTVHITTTYELANLHAWLSYAPKMMSKTAVEAAGQVDAEELSGDALVGTGPFEIAEFVRDETVTLNRFDGYWGDSAAMETIVFRPVADDSARMSALRTGELDLITAVPPAFVSELEGVQGVEVRSEPSLRYTYMWLNALKEPFDDVRVRQAANYAVDMDAIAETIFDGQATPADAPLAPGNFGYTGLDPYPYDPDKARELLAEAGHETPVEVTFWTPEARYLQDREVATAVQAFMNDAGFEVELNVQEWGSLSAEIFEQQAQYQEGEIPHPEHDMLLISWASVTLDADYALFQVFSCNEAYNLAYWCDSEVDALLSEARVLVDQAQREELYATAIELIWDDAPQLFGYYEPQIVALDEDLEGLSVLPFEHYLLHEARWR